MRGAALLRTSPWIGGLLLGCGLSGVGLAEPNPLQQMQWENRVFLVVADGGPARVPFKTLAEDPKRFFWKRRVGCAVYIAERRLLLTTSSVVGDNPLVEVFSEKGLHVLARVVGTDEHLDLALLEAVEDLPGTEGLEALRSSPEAPVGTPCMVLGSAYGRSLSACRGTFGEPVVMLSTGVPVQVRWVNVPIYPGDSGGPVLDPEGRFLGVITAAARGGSDDGGAVLERSDELEIRALRTRPTAMSGFAVPADACERAWTDLREHGRVRRGFLGVQMLLTESGEEGARVLQVLAGSPADRAGLLPGDRIVSVGPETVTDPRRFCALVAATPPDIRLELRYLRGEREHSVTVRLAEANPLRGAEPPPAESPLTETAEDRPSN